MRICSNKKMVDQSSQTHDLTQETSIREKYCQRCFVLITADRKSDASTQTRLQVFGKEYEINPLSHCKQVDDDVDQNNDTNPEIPSWSSLSDS